MVKLKSLILEAFNLFWYLVEKPDAVPLSIPVVQKLVGNIKSTKAAHVTELKYLNNLLSLKGKKKGISTFNSLDNSSSIIQGHGMLTKGGVIVILKGNVILQNNFDLWTLRDKSGRRWASSNDIFDEQKFDVLKNLPKEQQEVRQRFFASMRSPGSEPPVTPEEKREFIQSYIDTSTNLLLQHKKEFQKKYFSKPDSKSLYAGSIEDWNEIILTQVSIEKIAFVEEGIEQTDLDKMGLKEPKDLLKKYNNSIIIKKKDIPNFLKKHGISIK